MVVTSTKFLFFMTEQRTNDNTNTMKFGNWPSEISAELIASDTISIDELRLTKNCLYYIERRPTENGRCVIVRHCHKKNTDILPPPYSARSRVHEYGGGSYCADDELVFFVNDSDQDIYCIEANQITRITDSKNNSYADFCFDRHHQRLIAVCENHQENNVTNSIVSIDVGDGTVSTLVDGNDFYASPRLNTSTMQLCWQSWDHPNMPWDGNQLWLADINIDGQLANKKHIAGSINVSTFQPQWSPDNILYYISDDDGWWHLYRYTDTDRAGEHEQLTEGEKEFGLPQWVFAQSSYAFISNKKILCSYQQNSVNKLAILSLDNTSKLIDISTPWQQFSSLVAMQNNVCFIAASSLCFPQLVAATVDAVKQSLTKTSVIKKTSQIPLSTAHYSQAEVITFKNRHQQTVFANYYAPTNPNCQIDNDGTPPLIVISHGGPTAQSGTALDPKKQFWTSRGFALLDVNYGGSTGFGTDYRLRLNGKWGVLDVEDCCDAALYAIKKGLANKDQLIIRGSSAGGYTVLSALTFEQIFSAGASYYGISELTSLASDTHKFESHYLDKLIGPYPETKSVYQQRSPINSADQLNCPVIFFQGIEDKVVPKEQAEKMFKLLSKKGLTVAAQYFEGEQHGFRKAQTIIHSLENELNFYRLIFDLAPPQAIAFTGEIQINNR